MNFRAPVDMFRPMSWSGKPGKRRRGAARIVCEGRLLSDLTMEPRDWSQYDAMPTARGFVSERAKKDDQEIETSNVMPIETAFIRRQAQ